jgi:hypothetical protein
MSNLSQRLGFLAIPFLCLTLAGCLGSEVKTLGTKSGSAGATPATDADTFAITFAYRDGAGRVVQLQGVRTNVAAGLTSVCGVTGTSCACDFFETGLTSATATSATVGISKENNSFSCAISGATAPGNFDRVRFRTIDGLKMTGFIAIKTSLTLQQVIGDLSINKVNKIYKYTCSRTFFEGEGVSSTCAGGASSCINCLPNIAQRLGLINANYDYYLWDNKEGGGNRSGKFVASYWPGICGRADGEFARANCASSPPDTRYGLYSVPAGAFNIRIQMTRAPEQATGSDPLTTTYGYAATPDSSGNCPTGLVAVRPYMAQPSSITAGSVNGINPPSNFLNTGDGILNNTVIETSQPADFAVSRQANSAPCVLVTGSCATATFGAITPAQNPAVYTALSPVVCVIPKVMVDGI